MTSEWRRQRAMEGDPLPPEDWAGYADPSHDIDALYRSELPRMTRYLQRRAHPDDVLDFVQDSFRKLLGAAKGSAPFPDRPKAYLSRIAANLLRDRARTRMRQPPVSAGHIEDHQIAGPDPHGQLEARDMLRRADDAIAAMKPKTREVFLLHRIEGLDYNEIGERVGLSVKGVENQMSAALKLIRRRVGPR